MFIFFIVTSSDFEIISVSACKSTFGKEANGEGTRGVFSNFK